MAQNTESRRRQYDLANYVREMGFAKVERGELEFEMPVGMLWIDGAIVVDPDQRVQQAIRTVFEKFTELGSIRQVLHWFVVSVRASTL